MHTGGKVEITVNYHMRQKANLGLLIEKHRALDDSVLRDRRHFLSDWDGTHPLQEQFLGAEIAAGANKRPAGYIYFDEQPTVLHAVCDFHRRVEAIDLQSNNIVAGPGSSSLLVALSLWLLQEGYTEVFYVPPLYYTFHFFLRMLNVRLRPATGAQLFESGAVLNLPPRRTVLLLCDPIWYAGRRVPRDKIELIAEWQRKTNSIVIVDGSFQYMQWDGTRSEYSSLLDPELTFRLVSPTKSLAIPFFRFAYLIHPSRVHRTFVFLYENIVGGATTSDLVFAHRALELLSSDKGNLALTAYFRNIYRRLVEKELFRTRIVPECGYFVFAVPKVQLPNQVAMD